MSDSPNVDTVKKQIIMIKQLRVEAEEKADKAEERCKELEKIFELVNAFFFFNLPKIQPLKTL